MKRFNLGFGGFGPKEYCTTGKFVAFEEAKEVIEEKNKTINELQYYVTERDILIIDYTYTIDCLNIKYTRLEKSSNKCNLLYILACVILTGTLWIKLGT